MEPAGPQEEALQDLQQMAIELQQQKQVLVDQLRKAEQRMMKTKLEAKRSAAALEYIKEGDSSAKCYRQIARLFLFEERSDLTIFMQETVNKSTAELTKIEMLRTQVAAKLKSVDEQTNDVIKQVQKAYVDGEAARAAQA